ncbi:MAG: sensor histidine kinase [Pseudomonadota bacterium]|jgi:signal transduction histidine kinase
MSEHGLDERVLICVESDQDAERIIGLLGSLDLAGINCPDYLELSELVKQGAAAIIFSAPPNILNRCLSALSFLRFQPAWSAIPIILIVEESTTPLTLSEDLPLGVTLLERPIQIKTLACVIRIALSSRRNQYMVRNLLNERETLVRLLSSEAKMKNEFLATLAHELRNPLAPIRTGLGILRAAPGERPATQILEMMDRQVSHLVRLIDDLLDISRITCGKFEIRKKKVSLQSLVSDAIETSKPLIDAGKHTLAVAMPNELIILDVDPTRIAQVISNLLNNAAKYTPTAGTIALIAKRQDNTIQIEVKDDGVGLSPDMLTKIFDMFSQIESSIAHTQGGLGIGLTLARRLIEMHNGAIKATSPGLGKGSSFIVTLPYDQKIQGDHKDINLTFPQLNSFLIDAAPSDRFQ